MYKGAVLKSKPINSLTIKDKIQEDEEEFLNE